MGEVGELGGRWRYAPLGFGTLGFGRCIRAYVDLARCVIMESIYFWEIFLVFYFLDVFYFFGVQKFELQG